MTTLTRSLHPRRWGSAAPVAGLALLAVAVGPLASRPAAQVPGVRVPGEALGVVTALGGSYIGVSVSDLRPGDEASQGVRVGTVRDDGPAAAAGIQDGDLIVEFDGERVRSARQLSRLVDETPPGREVPLTVARGGARVALAVTPEAGSGVTTAVHGYLPDLTMPDIDRFQWEPRLRWSRPRLGVQAMPLVPQLADYFGVEGGVLVASVEDGSAAAAAGLRAGDVITAVGGQAVNDLAGLRQRGRRGRLAADGHPCSSTAAAQR